QLGLNEEQAAYILKDGLDGLRGKNIAQLRSMLTPKQSRMVAAVSELSRRMLRPSLNRLQIKQPGDAAHFLMVEMGHLDQEHLSVLLLDTKNRVQDFATIYIGSVNSAQVRVGEVFKEAIRRNSAAIIVAHNHPSGDCTPSPEDVLVTKQIVQAGHLLDIQVLDHLVIGMGVYVSMRERGLGWQP
ncbi:MAG: DNA repair protein RadC, partial [Candidatus Viridilinea halotolerans]